MLSFVGRRVVLAAPDDPTPTPTPSPTAGAGGSGLLPAVVPDMSSAGMAGFTAVTNMIAGWTLAICLFGFVLSALVFVGGPALGLRQARQYAAVGMIGAVGVAALVALSAGLINLSYNTFSS